MHPITDKAEVGIDFPDKFYSGGFGRDSKFEARATADEMLIRLVRSEGEKRAVQIHLHHFLFAAILEDLARSLAEQEPIDTVHREPLRDAARLPADQLDRVNPTPSSRVQ
jgi:hypothetical protein